RIASRLASAGPHRLRHLREGTALAALKARLPLLPPVVMRDAAKSFAGSFADQALCWLHTRRPLDALHPALPRWQAAIEAAQARAWAFYARLQAWAAAPDPTPSEAIEAAFDEAFVWVADGPALQPVLDGIVRDQRARLAVLRPPSVPLH